MPRRVKGPDGVMHEFPDDATDAEISEALGTPPATARGASPRSWTNVATDVGVGVLKGAGNTIFGLGKVVRDYTPVGRISDAILPGAFTQRPPELEPTTPGQRLGFAAEQIGEFFVPAGLVGKVGKAAEIGKAGLLTAAQGGSGLDVGLSAGLTGILPGAGGVQRAKTALQRGAEKSTVQALGPTKEWAKVEAQRVAPEMIARGVRGSRRAMLAQAETQVRAIGPKIADELAAAARRGEAVSTDVIRGNLQLARDAFVVPGIGRTVPGTERVVRRLDRLDSWLESLGPQIPVDQAAHIRRIWDRLVSKAGLYGPKAGAAATDQADAWAIREAAGSFRQLLNTNPSLAQLNADFHFWSGLRNVLRETERRTQAHGGGLSAAIGGSVGAAAGLASGEDLTSAIGMAAIGGAGFRKVTQLMQSPWWRTQVSSRLKASLADALASGSADQIERAAERILVSLPAQVG